MFKNVTRRIKDIYVYILIKLSFYTNLKLCIKYFNIVPAVFSTSVFKCNYFYTLFINNERKTTIV